MRNQKDYVSGYNGQLVVPASESLSARCSASTRSTAPCTTYGGSVRKVNPATGAYIWQTGLPCAVMGTPSLDGAGVLAAGTYRCGSSGTSGAYLINASTGAILKTLPTGTSRIFGQPAFAQDNLFVATETGGLYDFTS